MTALPIVVFTCAYASALAAVIYFARAPSRRVVGALAGAVAAACFGMGAIVLGDALGVWRVFLPSGPAVLALFSFGLAVSLAPIYLVTWRVARRFDWRGLAVCLVIVAVIGPPRDYFYASVYPQWMVFGKGMAPVLADAATYVGLVALGHAVMRLISGAAAGSRLTRQPSAA